MNEQNVIFNQDNIQNFNNLAVIQDEAQSEGERQKIIQAPCHIPFSSFICSLFLITL